MSQKYVVVHFIDATSVPDEFPSSLWPLHITLLANFTIAQPLELLTTELTSYAGCKKPFGVITDGEACFGPGGKVAVSLIKPSKNIVEIHRELSAITKKLGAVYDEPTYMGDGYRPHATIQTNARLYDRQTITVNDLSLVDMYPHGDINRRKIIKTFQLGS